MKNPNYQNHTEVDLRRRDALRQLVLVAIQAVGVAALGTRLSWAPEDILTHCAAGITACTYLAKGQREDMALSFSAISTYLPELEAIAKDSSVHRGEATRLVAQCYLLKHVLGLHRESPNVVVARGYAKLAFAYSKESGDLLLLCPLCIWLKNLSLRRWSSSCLQPSFYLEQYREMEQK